MTGSQIHEILTPLSKLNSWVRASWDAKFDMHDAEAAVYLMKNRTIQYALALGIAKLRIVAVERPCKVCQGTGQYKWVNWHNEYDCHYEDCRRCATSGRVILKFAESTIENVRWHTPRPRAGFLPALNWDACERTDWEPEQPGAQLLRGEIIKLLNEAERYFVGDKLIPLAEGGLWRNPFGYSLHLEEVRTCFVCDRPANTQWNFGHPIYCPGIIWKQWICERCRSRALRYPKAWPANLNRHGRGMYCVGGWEDHVPMHDAAQSEIVREWLRRRGIVQGCIPPGGYAFLPAGEFVQVKAIRNGTAFVRGVTAPIYCSSVDGDFLAVPANNLRPWLHKQLPAAQESAVA